LGCWLTSPCIVLVWCLCIDVVYGLLQYGIILVWPFMHYYNGTRGNWKGMKWFFYWFYVGHLVLTGLLRVLSLWKRFHHYRIKGLTIIKNLVL